MGYNSLLFRIELDDQLLLDVLGNVFALGKVKELTALNAFVPFDPGIFAVVETGEVVGDHFERFSLLAHSDNVAGLHLEGRDVDNVTVDSDVLVEHKLTGSGTRGSNTETIYDVVETAFEKLQEHFAGNTFGAGCAFEKVAELAFEHAVGVFSFLLFLKLSAVFGSFATAVVAVLAGG